MPTPIDDLCEGKFIAITGYVNRVFLDEDGTHCEPRWDGTPLKILTISLPFMAVWDGERRFALDVREVLIQAVSKKYAECLWYEKDDATLVSSKIESEDARDCPRCGERLREKLHISKVKKSSWHTHCHECGFDGGESSTYLERLADAKAKQATRKKKKGNDNDSVPSPSQ